MLVASGEDEHTIVASLDVRAEQRSRISIFILLYLLKFVENDKIWFLCRFQPHKKLADAYLRPDNGRWIHPDGKFGTTCENIAAQRELK